MKKTKIVSYLLSAVMAFGLVPNAMAEETSVYTYDDNNGETVNVTQSELIAGNVQESKFVSFDILGIEWYNGIKDVSNRDQLDCRFNIYNIEVSDNKIHINGIIETLQGDKVTDIQSVGEVFKSVSLNANTTGGIVALMNDYGNYTILNCTFEKSANEISLLPINDNMAGNKIMKLAIQNNNNKKVYYFEGRLPKEFDYDVLEYAADSNISNLKLSSSVESSLYVEDKIFNSESWRYNYYQHNVQKDGVTILDYNYKTRAYTPVAGIPLTVFTTEGDWASYDNPTNQQVGYYASTYPFAGTNNLITYLIKWEYLYNSPGNIPSGQDEGTNGATSIKLLVNIHMLPKMIQLFKLVLLHHLG